MEAQVGQGIVVQEQEPLGDFPTVFFLQNVLQLHQQSWVILRVDSLALWKIMNEEDAILIPKNWDENFSSGFLHSEFFWGGVSCYAAAPLIVALSAGHSDITRFRPWSPIATGIIWIVQKNFKKLLKWLAPLKFLIRIQAFRDPLRGELLHVQIFMNDGSTRLTWDAQLLSCWFNRGKISLWIWSIISSVVTVLGRPGRGESQVEKSPRLIWATQFLTAYSGSCSANVYIRMAWISFVALPCRKKKNLMTACITMLLKSHALPDMLSFSLCNKKILAIWHTNIPLFPTTLSIPSHYIGK